jgi:hypothetical protein
MRLIGVILALPLALAAGCDKGAPPSAPPGPLPGARAAAAPIEVVAILPFTGHWDRPSALPNEDDWEKKSRQLVEMFEDRLATAFVDAPAAAPWKLIPPQVPRSGRGAGQRAGSPLDVGTELGAGAVLTGAVTSKGHLSLQLLDVPSGVLLGGGIPTSSTRRGPSTGPSTTRTTPFQKLSRGYREPWLKRTRSGPDRSSHGSPDQARQPTGPRHGVSQFCRSARGPAAELAWSANVMLSRR